MWSRRIVLPMNITTKYKTNHNGTGQIVAKGGGRQRTVNYNPAQSPEWNHGEAAGTLAAVLGLTWKDNIVHEPDNGRHTFTF